MTLPPQRVVRFFGNTDYALQTIGFKEITFIHIDQLNDPFDPHVFFTTDFQNDYVSLLNYVREHHEKDIKKFSARLPQENWDGFLVDIVNKFNFLRNNTFLFSTSAVHEQKHPKDNLYMWSHYGNGHRGVVIEYDTNLLTKAVLTKSKKLYGEETNINGIWSEIHYTSSLPKITCESIFEFVINATEKPDYQAWDRTELIKIMKLMIRSKSLIWEKEDEWRLMWLSDQTRLKIQRIDMPHDTITAVYLGCLISDFVSDNLITETKRHFPNASVHKASQANGEFALEFKKLG